MKMLFCTFAAAAAAPPLASPASVWTRAYTQPQPGITETERERESEGEGRRRRMKKVWER